MTPLSWTLLAVVTMVACLFAWLVHQRGRRAQELAAELRRIRSQAPDATLASLPGPAWRRDSAGDIVFANAAAQPLLGDIDRSAALAARARETGRAQSESRNLVIDGNRRLFEIFETPETPNIGDGTIGYGRDVTALEQLQSDLARHVDAHAEVLEKLNSAIAVFGPDRRVVFANTAFALMWEINPDRLETGPTLSEVLDMARESRRLPEQSDFRAWREDFNRLFTTLIDAHEELLFLPDDSTIRMVVTPHPFGGLLMTFEDVTDRLTLERSYNTLTAVQQETLDNLYEGIVVFGVDSRMKLSNPTFRQQWGLNGHGNRSAFDESEPSAVVVFEAMRPMFPAGRPWSETKSEWMSYLAGREVRTGTLTLTDGLSLDFAVVPLPDGATLMNFRDVTDTLAVQNALQERTEALETADRLKSEFLANVSYELRTPLNAIIGFSEVLEQEYAGPMNDRQKDYANAILGSSNRLVRLVNDILDLATIEAGYLELERSSVDPALLANAVEGLARERVRARGVGLTVRCPDDLAPIEVDERRLTQALYNVVSNAVAFTPEGGQVLLSVEDHGDVVAFHVKDTGVGIAHDDQSRVFERFERRGRFSGAGLGLALVKSLVELHNGTVALSSEPGQGTEVVCTVPRHPPRVQATGDADS
ncbi:MAG: ATP-binding protein [Alphaproteobacteria bacterium]|nr:ATP-binding protein [Alphaproteobacteria bacterium]